MKSIDWKETTVGRRKKIKSQNPKASIFISSDSYTMPEGRVIEQGEIIKISGEHGLKFKFKSHVVRSDNGIEWIDCYELERGVMAKQRSFRPNRIKPIPKKRIRRAK